MKALTIRDLSALAMVASMAEGNRKVRWIDQFDKEHAGTARSIGDSQGNFLHDQDVREGYLRITSVMGFEFFIPVTNVMAMVQDGMIAIDD